MAAKRRDSDGDVDLIDKEKEKEKLKPPSKYNVVFYNDDFTPMDFVVISLIAFFKHSTPSAIKVMMAVHEKGKAIAGGPYSKEIADTKVAEVKGFARSNAHPLMAISEKT